MRFDIAVNNFVLDYYNLKKIIVKGKNNKRPFLHVQDAVRSYDLFLEASKSEIGGQIFNVGSKEQNYVVNDLAKEVSKSIDPSCEIETGDTPDNRSYFASFEKINKKFGFEAKYSVSDASKEIYLALKNKELVFSDKMITVKWYTKILQDPEKFSDLLINGVFI